MPADQYEKRSDSVLAWKKRNQLGRFDPNKEENEAKELQRQWDEVKQRGIEVGKRCKVGERRGTVRFVGVVEEIPAKGVWVGVEGDEPTGRFSIACFLFPCEWSESADFNPLPRGFRQK